MSKNFTNNFHTGELVETIGRALNGKSNGKGGFDLCDCPAHGGRECLSVDQGADGGVLLHCHTGCDFEAITSALRGMGLWPERGEGLGKTTAERAAESIARRRALEAEQTARHADAAAKAKALYEAANIGADTTAHPYNQERGGRWTGHTARRGNWPFHGGDGDALLLPYTDTAGELRTLQAISGTGRPFSHGDKKDYYPGGAKRGNFYTFFELGEHVRRFFIGEGFFTVQAAQEAFYQTNGEPPATAPDGWIVAGDAGNLEPVAIAIHAAHPAAKIIILADEDGEPGGCTKAHRAALAVGGKVARPSAGLPTGADIAKGYDFDNLLCEAGAGAVCAALDKAAKPEGGTVKDAGEAAYQEQAQREEARADAAEEEKAAREEAANALADAILANAQAATDRTEEPPPIRYIINPQLSDDTGVAFLVGPGGGGKSFQALIRCIAIASGRPIGKAHQTEVTAPALFFSLEDPPKVLQRRYFHTIAAIEEHYGPFSTGELAALDANLYRLPVRGQMGALMELDGKGNPRPTNDYHAVRKIIERTRPVLVVLDTMSRALGVDEQSNNHAAQWIAALERILFDYPETIFMIVGHTGKPGKGNQEEKADDPLSLRGASAFAWNARAVENYTRASDRERKFLGMEADTEVFKLTLPKHNYTRNLDGPIFFWRDAHGVPIEIDTEAMKNAKAQKAYDDAVRAVPVIAQAWEAKGRKLVKRDWAKRLGEDLSEPAKPKPGPEQIAHDMLTKHGITFDQVETAIAEAIRRGYVKTVEGERKGKRGPGPSVVEFVELPPDVDE